MLFFIKIVVSALVIAFVSEIAKRSTLLAALIISFPINSLLTFFWLYVEMKDTSRIYPLSWQIAIATVPSVIFLIILALLLRSGMGVGYAMGIALTALVLGQLFYLFFMGRIGIRI